MGKGRADHSGAINTASVRSILADRFQRTTHIASNLALSTLLNPECQFHDGGLKGKLVLMDLE
jgi:hypothetical protein